MGHVLVIGSLNVDLVVRCARMPDSGETVLGSNLERHPGGKGLNQAIAAARDAANVTMCGSVGNDDNGGWLVDIMRAEGIRDDFLHRQGDQTGTALIEVDDSGRNRIIVVPGANSDLTPEQAIAAVQAQPEGSVVLASLEVPLDTVTAGIMAARERGLITVVNPAPAAVLPPELLAATDVLVPNEHEVVAITNSGTIDAAIDELLATGVGSVLVTLGENGVRWAGAVGSGEALARVVDAVDTVAAGDSFCGVLAGCLAGADSFGDGFADGVIRAIAAAAITVTRAGAVPSLPRAAEIDSLLS